MVAAGRTSGSASVRAAKVLVAGAGIGGLAAALSLQDAGFDRVVVLEAAPELRPLGAGVNLLPNAVRELAALGLYHDVARRAVRTVEIRYHNQHGDLIMAEPRGRADGYDWPQLSIRRGELQQVLLDAVRTRLGECALVSDCRVTGVSSRSGVHVDVLRGGQPTRLTADLLVGADGIHSAVRRSLLGNDGEPVWNGQVVWRGMAWAPPVSPANSMVIMGDGVRKAVVYAVTPPRGDGHVLLNWAVSRRFDTAEVDRSDWNRPVPAGKFAHEFVGWRTGGHLLTDLFQAASGCFEYPMIDRDPLPTWSRGQATLLGDAAHAMHPMGSNATTQAVIDARALAYFMALEPDVERALTAYERHRRPVATQVQIANRAMGPEAVIDLVARRAPEGFATVDDVLPTAELRAICDRYAELAAFDRGSVNTRSPYDTRRARLVGANG